VGIEAERGIAEGHSLAFRGRLIAVEVRDTPAGRREVVLHPGAVAVLVRNEQGQVLLVRQYREGPQAPLWETPAGLLERGESPLTAARRELREEVGLTARRWRYLGTIWPTPGYSTERTYVFLASGLRGTPAARQEVDEVRFFAPSEILDLARRGHGDAKTLAALPLLTGG